MKGPESVTEYLDEILREDKRYPEMAYRFVLEALNNIIRSLPDPRHISGEELCFGCRDMAIEEFGPMARTVLEHWNIRSTEDLGEIVFNLVAKGLLSKTNEDKKEDFIDVYDFETAFDAPVTNGGMEDS
ncbi:MAG: Minf_1886 family protein [Candidatus Glassbacteria bacterium]